MPPRSNWGRRDARLLLDLSAVAHEHARPYLPEEVTRQIGQVLGQLRLGQVTAEGHAGQRGRPEENDPGRVPAPPPAGTAQLPAGRASGILRRYERAPPPGDTRQPVRGASPSPVRRGDAGRR